MKKNIISNILLIVVFLFSIISFSLMIEFCHSGWANYNTAMSYPDDLTGIIAERARLLTISIKYTVIVILNGLTTLTTIIIFLLKNSYIFKIRKKDE